VNGKRVLDSHALLAYLKKEDKLEKVKNLIGSEGGCDNILMKRDERRGR